MNIRLGLIGALLVTAVGCAVPKVMISDTFVPNTSKVARYSVKLVAAGDEDKGQADLSNFYIQICDVQGTTATNCKTTLVLENITDFQFTGYR